MQQEVIAGVAAMGAALVTAGPSYIAARRARRESQNAQSATATEGAATRDAISATVDVAFARIAGRLDGVRDELRADIQDVRAWQTSHTAEHMLIDEHRRGNHD